MVKETAPLKVSVTLDEGRTKRNYTADYVYVGLINENGIGSRWEQSPKGWQGGLGLFFTGMEAFRVLAEQEGDEGFKTISRSVMDLLGVFDPKHSKKERVAKAEAVTALLKKELEKNKEKKTKEA